MNNKIPEIHNVKYQISEEWSKRERMNVVVSCLDVFFLVWFVSAGICNRCWFWWWSLAIFLNPLSGRQSAIHSWTVVWEKTRGAKTRATGNLSSPPPPPTTHTPRERDEVWKASLYNKMKLKAKPTITNCLTVGFIFLWCLNLYLLRPKISVSTLYYL